MEDTAGRYLPQWIVVLVFYPVNPFYLFHLMRFDKKYGLVTLHTYDVGYWVAFNISAEFVFMELKPSLHARELSGYERMRDAEGMKVNGHQPLYPCTGSAHAVCRAGPLGMCPVLGPLYRYCDHWYIACVLRGYQDVTGERNRKAWSEQHTSPK